MILHKLVDIFKKHFPEHKCSFIAKNTNPKYLEHNLEIHNFSRKSQILYVENKCLIFNCLETVKIHRLKILGICLKDHFDFND